MVDKFCRAAFKTACDSVLPDRLVRQALSVDKQGLFVTNAKKYYNLNRNVYVAAFGKAAPGMCRAIEDLIGEHIVKGYASVQINAINILKENLLWNQVPLDGTKIEFYEGAANNLPDYAASQTASRIETMAKSLGFGDLLIVLVSGGGSALLPAPVDGVSLNDKLETVRLLGSSGADIFQLNTVRQNLSRLKGGRLAQIAYPAQVLSLIFSDVMGNDLQFIASGPTAPTSTTSKDAWKIINDFGLAQKVSTSVSEHLTQDKSEDQDFSHVYNVLIGDNSVALEQIRNFAVKNNFHAHIITSELKGEASIIGKEMAHILANYLSDKTQSIITIPSNLTKQGSEIKISRSFRNGICLIWGGESTVNVQGKGKGGRNQEMVLSFLTEAKKLDVTSNGSIQFEFVSGGTDGQDGPSDAAGAVVSEKDVQSLDKRLMENANEALAHNDSYNFFTRFQSGKCHLKPGLTGTNVMDVQIFVMRNK